MKLTHYFSSQIPSKIVIRLIIGIFFVVSVYVAYKIGEIEGRYSYPEPPRKTKTTNPMRVPLFVNPKNVRYESRFQFTFDPMEALKEYRRTEKLDTVIQGNTSEFEKILALLHWTRKQWEPGRPDPYPPINAQIILQEIRAGRTGGFCAQYNYVFVQALQSFGIKARYVTIQNHEVTEAWVKDLQKWVCFDPLFDAYYTDRRGHPLSVYEIGQLIKKNRPVTIVGEHQIDDIEAHLKKFTPFAIWLKNDHITSPINFTDIERYKVHFTEDDVVFNQLSTKLSTPFIADLYFDPYQIESSFPQK